LGGFGELRGSKDSSDPGKGAHLLGRPEGGRRWPRSSRAGGDTPITGPKDLPDPGPSPFPRGGYGYFRGGSMVRHFTEAGLLQREQVHLHNPALDGGPHWP